MLLRIFLSIKNRGMEPLPAPQTHNRHKQTHNRHTQTNNRQTQTHNRHSAMLTRQSVLSLNSDVCHHGYRLFCLCLSNCVLLLTTKPIDEQPMITHRRQPLIPGLIVDIRSRVIVLQADIVPAGGLSTRPSLGRRRPGGNGSPQGRDPVPTLEPLSVRAGRRPYAEQTLLRREGGMLRWSRGSPAATSNTSSGRLPWQSPAGCEGPGPAPAPRGQEGHRLPPAPRGQEDHRSPPTVARSRVHVASPWLWREVDGITVALHS